MSTPHDEIMEQKALKTMESNAEIIDIGVDLEYILEVRGEFDSGAAGLKRTRTETSCWELKDIEQVNTFLQSTTEEKLEFINGELLSLFPEYKTIEQEKIQPVVTLKYRLKYFTGKLLQVKETFKLTSKTISNFFLTHFNLKEPLEIKIKNETEKEVTIELRGEQKTLQKITDESLSITTPLEKFTYTYLSNQNLWAEGTFQTRQTDEEIIIDFILSEYTVSESFSPPFFDTSNLNKLMETFDCSDPLHLEGKRFKYTFSSISTLGNQYKLLQISPEKDEIPFHTKTIDSLKRKFNQIH